MLRRPNCEAECPLILACNETATVFSQLADAEEETIADVRARPEQTLAMLDNLGMELDEKVVELTYESMAQLTDEEAEAVHADKRRRDKTYRVFEEITLHDDASTQIDLIKGIQQARRDLAAGAINYAEELRANCKKGVGSVRAYGLVGTKYLFCRSDGQEMLAQIPFERTEAYSVLQTKLKQAHDDLGDYYKSFMTD